MIVRGQLVAEANSHPLPPMVDLEWLVAFYQEKIDRDLEDLQLNPNFSDGVESLYRDTNMMALVALAIAHSDEPGKYKEVAPAILDAAQELSSVDSINAVKKGVVKLQKAMTAQSTESIPWSKVASLSPIMKKAVPSLSTEIKRLIRNEATFRRSANAEKVIGAGAALAVIGAGSHFNVDETLSPNETELWVKYCDTFFHASNELNRVAHDVVAEKAPFTDLTKAFEAVDATCNTTCHEKFGGSAN